MPIHKKYDSFIRYIDVKAFNGKAIRNNWYVSESYFNQMLKGLKNYRILFNFFDYSNLRKDHYLYPLASDGKKRCAFCLKEEPEVTFSTRPHVIPELLGNRFLLHYDECDDCNSWFGKNFEAKLGSFTQPFRMLNRIKNKKNKFVTYQAPINPKCQFKFVKEENVFSIISRDEITFNEEKNEFTYEFKIKDYIPLDIYKSFMKIFYGLLPREIRHEFGNLRKWITDKHNNQLPIKPLIGLMTFLPDMRKKPLAVLILCDYTSLKADECSVKNQKVANFKYISLIAFGNLVFEFPLICDEDIEKIKQGISLTINRMPNPYQIKKFKKIDFSSNTKETFTFPMVFSYGEKKPIDSPPLSE